MSELETMRRALQSYASHAPLDLHSPADIQRDLLAIAGRPHFHRASLGSSACLVCKRDWRDPVHFLEDRVIPLARLDALQGDDDGPGEAA